MHAMRFSRSTSMPIERAWLSWTTAHGLAEWWWSHLPDDSYDVDFQIGGRYRFVSAIAGIGVGGEYVAIEAPNRFLMTWIWDGEPSTGNPDTVEVLLREEDGAVRVEVEHRTRDFDRVEPYSIGWNDVLDRWAELT